MTDLLVAEERFAPVPEWVIYHAGLDDRAVRLYAVLLRHADREGRAFPSRSRLARLLGCSVDSVDRAMKQLRSAGAVTVESQSCEGGFDSNLYTVVLAAPVRHPSRNGAATPSRRAAAQNDNQVERDTAAPQGGGRDLLFEAVCQAVKTDWTHLTRPEHKKLSWAVSELRRAEATPEQVKARAARWPHVFRDCTLTAAALVNHWGLLAEPEPPKGHQCPPHRFVDMEDGRYCVACKTWEKEEP